MVINRFPVTNLSELPEFMCSIQLSLNYKALNLDFIARSFQEVLHVEVQENINEEGWYVAALQEECRSNTKR